MRYVICTSRSIRAHNSRICRYASTIRRVARPILQNCRPAWFSLQHLTNCGYLAGRFTISPRADALLHRPDVKTSDRGAVWNKGQRLPKFCSPLFDHYHCRCTFTIYRHFTLIENDISRQSSSIVFFCSVTLLNDQYIDISQTTKYMVHGLSIKTFTCLCNSCEICYEEV